MPTIIEHPELGEIEFPDGMSEGDMLKAIDAHLNKGFEIPQPGDDDVSTGLPAGVPGVAPQAPQPIPQPPTAAGMFAAPPPPDRLALPALPPLENNTLLQPWNYVPKDVGEGPLTVGTFDAEKKDKLSQLDAYFSNLKAMAGDDPAKQQQIEQARQEALKGEGVGVVGDNPFGLKLPRVESSDLQTLGLGKTASDVLSGVQNAAAGSVEFFGSPEGVALLSTGRLPVGADVHRLISGAFTGQMASQLPRQVVEAAKSWQAGNTQQAAEQTASAIIGGLFTKQGFDAARGPAKSTFALNPMREVNMINRMLSTGEFRPGQPLDPALRQRFTERRQTLLDNIHGAESELSDLADNYDMPIQISALDPTTGEPWEPGTYAKMGPEGKMFVNRIGLHGILGELSEQQRGRFLKSLVEEEWIHKNVSTEDALDYWDHLTTAEQNIVAQRYAGSEADQFSDAQLGHEAIRARLQQLAHVTPTEIAHADGLNIEARTLIALENIVGKVRRAVGTEASKSQEAVFNRVKANIDAAREKLGVKKVSEREAIDAGEPAEVPAATDENAPFAFRKTEPIRKMEEMFAEGGNIKDQTRRSFEIGRAITSKEEIKELLRMQQQKKVEFQEGLKRFLNATPEEQNEIVATGMSASQTINEALEKATGFDVGKNEPGESFPVPMTKAELDALTEEVRKETNASGQQKTTEVHGDVQPQPGESAGEMPAKESGGGIQPREEPAGAGAEKAPEVLRLKEAAEDPGLAAMKAKRAARLAAEGKNAAAFRKKGTEQKEELPLLPGSKEAPRNTEELGLPQVERESVTPAKVTELSAEHMDTPKPSFHRFVEDAQERFGNIQPGQLAEAWEDAVWKRLMKAPGTELEGLAKRLGLIERVGGTKEGVQPGFIPDVRAKMKPEVKGTQIFPEMDFKDIEEHPPRRANAIARIAEKLISQATTKRADLKRKGVTPEDIGFWRTRVGDLPAFREVPADEALKPNVGTQLTEGGAMERGGAKTTSGLKGYPESVTKRLVALQDRATGRMELVSVYRTGRGTVYAADPGKSGERIHTPLTELLGKKTIGGEQRYVPRFSLLLDEPVQGFRESFKSEADFQEKIGAEASEMQRRMEEAEAEAEENAPMTEGKPQEKGILFRQEKSSPDSFRALHDVLGMEELGEDSMGDLVDNMERLFAENRGKDKTGKPRELTIRELKGVDALLFAEDRMMEMAREQGTPISRQAALSNVLDYLNENKDLSRSEFANKAFEHFTPKEKPVSPKAGSVSGGTARPAKVESVTRDLILSDRARKAKVNPLKPQGSGPKAYLSGKDTPAAFRKPTKEDVLWGAERAYNAIKAQVGGEILRNPISRQITAWKDAADNIPANLGRKAYRGLEVNLPKGKNDELHRAAVLAYRETMGGNSALLDNAKASVEIGLQQFRAEKNSEAVRQGELMLKAIEFVRTHGHEVAQANSFFNKSVVQEWQMEKARGIEVTKRDDYTPHVYNADGFTDDALIFPSRILGHKFTAAQQFSSYFSAYENGFYPKKYDAAAVLENRIRRGQKQIQARLWMERVKNTIDPKSGEPVAAESEPYDITLTNGTVETRYKAPSPEYELFSVAPGQKPIAIRKGYKDLMDLLTMQSPLQKSAAGRAALNASGFLKHSVILIYDTFHPSRIGQYGMAVLGFKPKLWELGNRGASALDYADSEMDKAVAKGFITQDAVDWARGTERIKVGGGYADVSRRDILHQFEKEGLNVGRISDALYRELTDHIPFVGSLNRFTFDKLTRGLMAETAVSEFVRQNKKFPDHDSRQLMRDILRDINFRFGNIGRQGLIRNPAIRDAAQLFFLAPSWVEGMAQSEARFYVRLLKSPYAAVAKSGQPNMGTIGHIMGRGLASYFVLTQALNLITKHQTTFQNEEGHKFDAWIPDVTGKTPGFWFSPLSVFAEVTHDIVKYVGKSDRAIDGLAHIIGNKLGPLGRVLATFMFRENPQGEKITTTGGVLKQAAKELFPAPISLSKLGQAAGNAVAPSLISPAKPGDVQRQAFASAGFKIDPAETSLQKIRDKAEAFVKKNHLKREDSEFQLTDQAFYTQLRRAVRTDQDREAMRAIADLRKDRSDKEIEKSMARYAKRMFTGSREHEKAFVKSLSDADQEQYKQAREEQNQQFKKFVTLWEKRPARK